MEQERDNSLQQSLKELIDSTVFLETKYANKCLGGGSGFFIAPDKFVTNIHVLIGTAAITAKCSETETDYTIEGIVAFDDKNDLAVLKIAEKGTPFPIGDSSTVRKGDRVCLIGYPKKKARSVEGTVHSVRNNGKHLWVDFESSAGPGYSGGPLLNAKGEVIAVAQSGYASLPDRGKTISANVLKPLLTETQAVESLDVWQRHPQIHAYVIASAGDRNRVSGEYKTAIAHYDTALQLNPALSNVYTNRAQVKSLLGKHDEALADSRAALKFESERLSFSRFDAFLSDRWKIAKLFLRSLYLKPRMRLGDKLRKLLINLDPEYPKQYNEQGNAKSKLDDFAGAIADYNIAIHLNPEYNIAYFNRGLAKFKLGDFAGAIADYNNAIELNLEGDKAYLNRGLAKRKLGNYKGAIIDYDNAIKLNPKAYTYYTRGLAKKALRDFEGAIADYDDAIKLDPEYESAYFNRGYAKRKLGDCEGAIDDYNDAIKLNPEYATAHHNRGYAKYKLNDFEGAIADYDNAIKLNPEYALAYKNRGRAKKALGQGKEAKADFRKAKELDPDFKNKSN